MIPSKEIKIKSDGNVLILDKVNKDGTYTYKYSKSKTKKGQLLTLTENDLMKLINRNEQI